MTTIILEKNTIPFWIGLRQFQGIKEGIEWTIEEGNENFNDYYFLINSKKGRIKVKKADLDNNTTYINL